MVEHHLGKGEMDDKEYEQNLFSADQLHPEAGGRNFEPQMAGTRYLQQSRVWGFAQARVSLFVAVLLCVEMWYKLEFIFDYMSLQ